MVCARTEDQILVCVARQSLDAAKSKRLHQSLEQPVDWEYLLSAAEWHCLIPQLYFHLNQVGPPSMPAGVMSRLKEANVQSTQRSLFLTGELVKLSQLFEENGVQAIPFKGPTLALLAYGDTGSRQFGDLDILVRKNDVLRAKQLLLDRGFKPIPELTNNQQAALLRFDSAYNFDNQHGVVIDLHWRFVEPHFAFDLDLDRLWERREPLSLSGNYLWTISSEDLLLILCLHGFSHLWERLGWICDVAGLIDRSPDLDWELLLQNAANLGCRRILSLGLLLSTQLLEATVPEKVMTLSRDYTTRTLAGQIKERLSAQRSGSSSFTEGVFINLKMRERLRDQLKSFLRFTMTPRRYDWMFVSVPASLSVLYYLIRPIRMIRDFGLRVLHAPSA